MAIRLYWWDGKRNDNRKNYGDLLSKYLVEKISGKKVVSIIYPSSRRYKYFFKKHYLVIGSIIRTATENSIVWGSGIISKKDKIKEAEFLAVRGPQTRKRILELGFKCPEVYGDPGILLPNYYHPEIEKKFKIGIIPHFYDYQEIQNIFKNDKRVNVINLLTNSIEDVTSEILKCEQIISSSLHGLIISHSYYIPALWIKFSNKLDGDNVKFYDYFESMGIDFKNEIHKTPTELNFENINIALKENSDVLLVGKKMLEYRKAELLKACPFAKNNSEV
ncbi:polysaccharide pyruvyl transferase family protein [Tamlana crocina]|uniref:Polysaccharide pyruvyl transferase family protein n=1 Tax=Tamlana crocina TaxID=393006 RepID=A0ABX1DBW8_9FLAO|nr:polysaccharide pyruvyl transferase family protein [Tamlana crocina]NJX15154.1 polysaccharide pyruvyl transferase family protein [Tamlana crocina]